MSRKYCWRKIFTYEYRRCDYDCAEVWTNEDSFRLVKFHGNLEMDGKWCLFSPFDKMLGRTSGKNAPTDWADSVISKDLK